MQINRTHSLLIKLFKEFFRLTIKPLYYVSGHSSFKKIAGPLARANFTWE